jgi:RNA polymerase sigma-70 factor (ECF subfamily)
MEEMAQWLAAARGGSRDALGQALEACRGYLLVLAQRQLDPELQAKEGGSDLVQETFLEAQRDFGHFHGKTEDELLAWLRQLLLNNLANFTRRYRATAKRRVGREVALEGAGSSAERGGNLAADSLSPSGLAMQHERALALQQALARLPDDYRQVIVLRYQEERPFEEIARQMNRSTNAVRLLWSRAIRRLRQDMEGSTSEAAKTPQMKADERG